MTTIDELQDRDDPKHRWTFNVQGANADLFLRTTDPVRALKIAQLSWAGIVAPEDITVVSFAHEPISDANCRKCGNPHNNANPPNSLGLCPECYANSSQERDELESS
jgi:hypothetical protein